MVDFSRLLNFSGIPTKWYASLQFLTGVACAAALPHGGANAAEMRPIGSAQLASVASASVTVDRLPSALPSLLGVDAESGFAVKSSDPLPNNQGQAVRMDQLYRGVPVWGQQVVVQVSPTGQIAYLSGTAVFGVGANAPAAAASLGQDRAMEIAKGDTLSKTLSPRPLIYRNEESALVYYLTNSGDLKLTYRVSFYTDLLDAEGKPSPTRPVYFIDANTGETIYRYENIQHLQLGTGPGGNQKTGQWNWGSSPALPKFQVLQNGATCTMDDGAHVFAENLNHATDSGTEAGTKTPFSFACFNNTYQTINGGYSPLNDAHSFGYALYNMYQTWYGQSPITQKLWLRVHYGTNYENAFWNGDSMAFGDGATTFYPLVGLDVTGHEISHGFTEQHSGLIYSGQSGGMNEAFSDIAGEALEYFYSQTYGAIFPRAMPDYNVGAEIFKTAGAALRYMCTPKDDRVSIDNAFAFGSSLDVHNSSGVYNKAFCVLAKTTGWNAKKAFDVFHLANQSYWTPSTDFASGADAVKQAAVTLGYSTADVIAAFNAVGLLGAPNRFTTAFAGNLNNSSLTEGGRLSRNGLSGTCASTKAYPGTVAVAGLQYSTQQYTHAGSSRCVTFWLDQGGSCDASVQLSIYSGGFDPANIGTNYLADSGTSGEGPWMSVPMSTGQSVTLVVNGVSTGLNCSFKVSSDDLTGTAASAPHDFNGDGKSDVLWRNSSGEAGIWFMNGASVTSTPSLGIVPNNWSIAGQRDFDGNGKSDILWRNTGNDIGAWYMNGASITSSPIFNNVGPTWFVVGTADFDGDGKGDILWRNSSGDLGMWFLNGGSYTPVVLGNVPTNWSVIGTGDFNGDGKADILWRNTANDVGIWFMNGTSLISAPVLGNVGPTWTVAGTGDFDGDGKGDILWRNNGGSVGIWFMNGASVTPVDVGGSPLSWSIVSVGDYNGDGKSDMFWRSNSDDVGIWFMNGASVTSTPIIGNVGPSWIVQNAASN